MQFTVITADETETPHAGSYKVLDNGVLLIHPNDESQPIIRLSPAYWRQINEPREHYDILESVG